MVAVQTLEYKHQRVAHVTTEAEMSATLARACPLTRC